MGKRKTKKEKMRSGSHLRAELEKKQMASMTSASPVASEVHHKEQDKEVRQETKELAQKRKEQNDDTAIVRRDLLKAAILFIGMLVAILILGYVPSASEWLQNTSGQIFGQFIG